MCSDIIDDSSQSPPVPGAATRGQQQLPARFSLCHIALCCELTMECGAEVTVDAVVQIHGLVGAPEHNGKIGKTLRFDSARGRWIVQLSDRRVPLAVRAANLHTAEAVPQRCVFKVGDTVNVKGLRSEAGARLNGKAAKVMAELNESGRLSVYFGDDNTSALLKPINLSLLLTTDQPGVSGTARRALRIIRLMEAGDSERQLEWHQLMGPLDAGSDRKTMCRLTHFLAAIFDCIRSWREVGDDPSKLSIGDWGNGAPRVRLRHMFKSDGEKQGKLVMRALHGVQLLGSLSHFVKVRRYAQSSDTIAILADMCRSRCFDRTAFPNRLQCAAALLNFPGASNSKHTKMVCRFFASDVSRGAAELARRGGAQGPDTPLLNRLLEIRGATNTSPVMGSTPEFAHRLCRWAAAYQHGTVPVFAAELRESLRSVMARPAATPRPGLCNAHS